MGLVERTVEFGKSRISVRHRKAARDTPALEIRSMLQSGRRMKSTGGKCLMAVRLVPLEDGPPISLDRPIVFVGRHSDCDVRIDSKKISRRHCCIIQLQDRLVIRDLGSTNGVYCNGQRVEEAVLTPQDEVQIANIRYQVIVNDSASGLPVAGSAAPPVVPPAQEGGISDEEVRRRPVDSPSAGQLT